MSINIKFINDNNITLSAPEYYNIDNKPYKWYQHFLNSVNLETKTRLIVSNLINTNIIDKNKNIIDCGAFVGDNTLPWAKNINGKIYAIDPSDNNRRLIEHLCDINNIKNVVFIQNILSDHIKELSYNGDLDFNSFIYNNCENKTTTISIDILHENKIINNIDFIHLDVEGMEYEALVGSKKIIKEYNPIIIYEQHIKTDDCSKIINLLREHGYEIYIIDEKTGSIADCRNFLSITKTRYDNFLKNFTFSNFCIDINKINEERAKVK